MCFYGIFEFFLGLGFAVITWVDGESGSWHHVGFGPVLWAGARQVKDFCHIEQQRRTGDGEHEEDEDGLLGGTRHVTLDGEGAGGPGADHLRVHDEPVQIILPHDEGDLQKDSENNGGHVGPQEVALDLHMAFLVWVLGVFGKVDQRVRLHVFSQLVFFVDDVHDMSQVDQRRGGDEDDLKDPETNVRDGEGVVVADVFTTGLLGVTNHIGLLITPNLRDSQRDRATAFYTQILTLSAVCSTGIHLSKHI